MRRELCRLIGGKSFSVIGLDAASCLIRSDHDHLNLSWNEARCHDAESKQDDRVGGDPLRLCRRSGSDMFTRPCWINGLIDFGGFCLRTKQRFREMSSWFQKRFWYVSQGQTGEIRSQGQFVIWVNSEVFLLSVLLILILILIVGPSISSLIRSFIHHFFSNSSTSIPLKTQPSVWMSCSCFGCCSCLYWNVLCVCVCVVAILQSECDLLVNVLSDNIYSCGAGWLSAAPLHSGAQPLFSSKLMDTCCLITAVSITKPENKLSGQLQQSNRTNSRRTFFTQDVFKTYFIYFTTSTE